MQKSNIKKILSLKKIQTICQYTIKLNVKKIQQPSNQKVSKRHEERPIAKDVQMETSE